MAKSKWIPKFKKKCIVPSCKEYVDSNFKYCKVHQHTKEDIAKIVDMIYYRNQDLKHDLNETET